MDLKIKDVAQLLNVSESTIRQWVHNKQIPSYLMGKDYRFSRSEIEKWVMSHPFHPTPSPSGSGIQPFSLFRAIHKGLVLHDVPGKTKEDVIRTAMSLMASDLNLDPEIMTDLLLDRESLMPTSLNNGVGVPHTRDTLLNAPHDAIAVVFPENPLDYGALDGKPVDILFFLFACEDKRHLHLLAKIAHLSSHSKTLSFLRQKPTKEKLMTFIKDWESSLTGIPNTQT